MERKDSNFSLHPLSFIILVGSGQKVKLVLNLGKFDRELIEKMIKNKPSSPGDSVSYLSGFFLGVPYSAKTLPSFSFGEEPLVINFGQLDCMTLIEYVEALRLAENFEDFKKKLSLVRYRMGILSFRQRRHFFSDWMYSELKNHIDVTPSVCTDTVSEERLICFLTPFIEPQRRVLRYIDSSKYDEVDLSRLKNGDYIGFVSEDRRLDFTHCGIVIRDEDRLLLRHASSKRGFVLDEDLRDYLRRTPGFVVLRPT